jgi:hypothetical protein
MAVSCVLLPLRRNRFCLYRRIQFLENPLTEFYAVIISNLRFRDFCHLGINVDIVHPARKRRVNWRIGFRRHRGKIKPAELKMLVVICVPFQFWYCRARFRSSFSKETSTLLYPGVLMFATLFAITRVRSICPRPRVLFYYRAGFVFYRNNISLKHFFSSRFCKTDAGFPPVNYEATPVPKQKGFAMKNAVYKNKISLNYLQIFLVTRFVLIFFI